MKENEHPWALSWEEVRDRQEVILEEGLSEDQVTDRKKKFGANTLRQKPPKSVWLILAAQFRNLIMVLLALAAIVSFSFGELPEGLAIGVVIILNAMIGFFTELRAVRSMEALRKLSRTTTKVRREGSVREVPAEELVPGDVVILEGGDVIAADMRIASASKLQVNESTLTGESEPVEKGTDPVGEAAPLAERSGMLYKGTALTRGSGEAVVTSIGMDTELGRISSLVEEAEEEITPLEKRLNKLGRRLIWVTLVIAVIVVIGGISAGKELLLMIETSIALAVAAVPEGLPIVATIALARGMWRMARRNALINRLSAVETLGATSVIFTDKTGTLTENQMTVTRIVVDSRRLSVSGEGLQTEGEFRAGDEILEPLEDGILRAALEAGLLCNNAALEEDEEGRLKGVGEPLEVALIVTARKAGLDKDELTQSMPEIREEAFESETKMMATFNQARDHVKVSVKGAPEAVLSVCSSVLSTDGPKELSGGDREYFEHQNRLLAEKGLRMLALAGKKVDDVNAEPYEGLELFALVGMVDPPREDVKEAIAACRSAGIKVVMVTGDQPVTARYVGSAVGLVDGEDAEVIHGSDIKPPEELSEDDRDRLAGASLFARVTPEQKLNLIALQQQRRAVVAMTGDGVNDAPALKKADIGVAMGQRGTEVAREAADMVLKDDRFASIVAAVSQGRVIFGNIRKFVVYLLSCNISEIMAVFLASVVNAPLPILPLQILFLNLVTDVFPALALGVGEGDPHVMKHKPRPPGEPIMTGRHWATVGAYGTIITAAVLAALATAMLYAGLQKEQAVTVSFLTLALAQLWHVFNMRETGSGIARNDITRNPLVWGALGFCCAMLVAAVYTPVLSDVLSLVHPGSSGWLMAVGFSLVPLAIGQVSMELKAVFHGRTGEATA